MALGDNCRTGCLTKDHRSWGECAKSAALRVGWVETTKGLSRTADRLTERELGEYRDLRATGIQPAGTSRHHIEEAKRISEATGSAYNAEKSAPTNLLKDKRTISAAVEAGVL